MNIEEIRNYCLSKDFVTESLPFGDDALVFKVAGKMFLLANLDGPLRISIKASPDEVIERQEKYPEAIPAYHMNKQHWVSVVVEQVADLNRLRNWIDRSYELVLLSLPKKQQQALKGI
ncbi:MAG: MmcQ/YjbR family DNA-binding protein [Bacteroidetes bacterium]|jgi:predicted DNA-binding protein (MmcQ/YjbR family)|nr:MmcQ/YjbR family DNA-binding protein [Bacteroidota bacterium]